MQKRYLLLGLLMVTACAQPKKNNVTAGKYKDNEAPDYKVIKQNGAIQIREYPALLTAQTTVKGGQGSAANRGFRIIADYIFGNNEKKSDIAMTSPVMQSKGEKIAMTSPVTMQPNNDVWTIGFIMPRKYTMETLPKPVDNRVTIKEIPAKKQAAISFSGLVSDTKIDENVKTLQTYLKQNDYNVKPDYMLGVYDNPYATLPWNRRNEILIELETK